MSIGGPSLDVVTACTLDWRRRQLVQPARSAAPSAGGWRTALPMPPPRNGLAIIRCAELVSWPSAGSGSACVPHWIFRSALARASGSPVSARRTRPPGTPGSG